MLCPTLETSWIVAHQAPLSIGFSSKNIGVSCHFLLQEIFTTQGLNPGLCWGNSKYKDPEVGACSVYFRSRRYLDYNFSPLCLYLLGLPWWHGNPLQYSCLENLHGQRISWPATVRGVTKRRTQLIKHSTAQHWGLKW